MKIVIKNIIVENNVHIKVYFSISYQQRNSNDLGLIMLYVEHYMVRLISILLSHNLGDRFKSKSCTTLKSNRTSWTK